MARKKKEEKDKNNESPELTLTEKDKRLNQIIDSINGKYKKKVVGNLSDPDVKKMIEVEFIPTASPDFNINTGGGFPKGKMSIISGKEDSGKTSFVLNTVGMNMKKNPKFTCAWLESEDSLVSMDYLEKTFGIDLNRFYVIPFLYSRGGEAALDDLIAFIGTGAVDICVINTLRALTPISEIQKSVEAQDVALNARMNSRFISKVIPLLSETDTTLVCVQQRSTKVGGYSAYGDNTTLSGGLRIRYHSMLTARLNRLKMATDDPISPEEGVKISVVIEKNHSIPSKFPYRKFTYYAVYGEGIETILSTLQLAVEQGIILRRGAHLYYYGDRNPENDEPIFHWTSKSDFRDSMKANPSFLEDLSNMVQHKTETLSEEEVAQIQAQEKEEEKAAGVDLDESSDPMTEQILDTEITKEESEEIE